MDLSFGNLFLQVRTCRGFVDGLQMYFAQFADGDERWRQVVENDELEIRLELVVSSAKYHKEETFFTGIQEDETVNSVWQRLWASELGEWLNVGEHCSHSTCLLSVYVAYGWRVVFDCDFGVRSEYLVDLVEGN